MRVAALRLQRESKQPMETADSLELVEGRGIAGDCHYYSGSMETGDDAGLERVNQSIIDGQEAIDIHRPDKTSGRTKNSDKAKRQVSMLPAQAEQRIDELGRPGLCMKKFAANMVVDGLGIMREGESLSASGAELRITQVGKPCFADDCDFTQAGEPCPLRGCMYAMVIKSGVVRVGDVLRVL